MSETTKPWRRYRLKTHSVSDYRPLVFNAAYPWWCSGYGDDYAIIISYLPATEDVKKYWDDAHDVDFTEEDAIRFSDRFPKPSYFKETT